MHAYWRCIETSTCFHRARSASKKGTWPLPALLANFFSILLKEPLNTEEIRSRRPRVRNS